MSFPLLSLFSNFYSPKVTAGTHIGWTNTNIETTFFDVQTHSFKTLKS